jgi:hypothetical protein
VRGAFAGRNGKVDVTPGYVIPDLGRVAAIRRQGGRWQVVIDNGTVIQRRAGRPARRRHRPCRISAR